MGERTNPDDIIRSEATWKAVRFSRPSLIRIKLLPQINESAIKMSQLINLLFKICTLFSTKMIYLYP